jgi:hypothetical protein
MAINRFRSNDRVYHKCGPVSRTSGAAGTEEAGSVTRNEFLTILCVQEWANNGWLRTHSSSPREVADLLAIVDRDLADAEGNMSSDWRFGIAYNGALKLRTILLHASGYRAERNLQQYRTIAALPIILGEVRKDDADYLEVCPIKRNKAEYDSAGVASLRDAEELMAFTRSTATSGCTRSGRRVPGYRQQSGGLRWRAPKCSHQDSGLGAGTGQKTRDDRVGLASNRFNHCRNSLSARVCAFLCVPCTLSFPPCILRDT